MSKRVICDIDGCLIPERGKMWDFAALAKVAEIVQSGKVTLSLCSGRPPAFQEALARMLMIDSYCICENGALLMHPISKKMLVHPDISPDFMRERPAILQRLHELVNDIPAVVEFGKEVLISVNPPDKNNLVPLMNEIEKALHGAPMQLFNSSRSIEVMPRGVSKKAGLAFWAEVEGVPISEVTSIGDADNDLDILETAGTAAAPANCTPRVRETVDYVSDQAMVQGVYDIIRKVAEGVPLV